MIEGDIKGYFDNIDHHVLARILRKYITDPNLMDLYWKFVKAGYIENGNMVHNHLGVPQGGTLSPLLSNIYLHELDMYIEQLKLEYDKLPISRESRAYITAHSKQI